MKSCRRRLLTHAPYIDRIAKKVCAQRLVRLTIFRSPMMSARLMRRSTPPRMSSLRLTLTLDTLTKKLLKDHPGPSTTTLKTQRSWAEIVKILGRQPDEENGSLTYVFVSPGPSLIVGYGLGGGSMDDSEVTIRAYKPLNGLFALTAEIGSDTDAEWKGVSFYMRELPSPITGETWLLTWGVGVSLKRCRGLRPTTLCL